MSDDVPLGVIFGFLVFLLFCSAFFSGTETALMTLNRYRLRHKAKSGHRGAILVEKLLAKPDRLIGLILFGNNLVNIGAASLTTLVAFRIAGPAGIAVSSILLTFVVLIFAEVTPKTLAALHPEKVALPAAYIYYPLSKLLLPVIWLINMCANNLLRLFGVQPGDAQTDHLTIEELRTLVTEAGTLLPRRRHQMLVGILDLQDITVDDIMVPQNEVVGIDLNDSWDDILSVIRHSTYTRLPVFRDSIDDVTGLLHLKAVVQSGSLENLDCDRLEKLAEEPYFVPDGTPLNKQLVQFQRSRQRTAFIVDEYGDIRGIVTLEDILEEIIGEFTSESAPPFHTDVQPDTSGGYVVNAAANVRALNRTMNWHLPTDGPKTLNGLILEQLEIIPERGAGLVLNDYEIEILETGENVVKAVRIREPRQSTQALAG